jgi:hypothetical protein
VYVSLSLAALYRSLDEQEKMKEVIAELKSSEEFAVKDETNLRILDSFEKSIEYVFVNFSIDLILFFLLICSCLNKNECVGTTITEPGTPLHFFRCEICNPNKPSEVVMQFFFLSFILSFSFFLSDC